MSELSRSILGVAILAAGVFGSTATAAEAITAPTEIDAAGTTLFLDQGRLELRGSGLRGVHVEWRAGARTGGDSCVTRP